MTQHMLKCYPEYFEAIMDGTKTFECRYNDRDFKVGDELLLREHDPKQGYTSRCIVRKITYILSDFIGLKDGYVILGVINEPIEYF
ncbi:RNA-binding protein [Streptococcus iniae]|nr:RNA-binding protein [Streptococcus iniae]